LYSLFRENCGTVINNRAVINYRPDNESRAKVVSVIWSEGLLLSRETLDYTYLSAEEFSKMIIMRNKTVK